MEGATALFSSASSRRIESRSGVEHVVLLGIKTSVNRSSCRQHTEWNPSNTADSNRTGAWDEGITLGITFVAGTS